MSLPGTPNNFYLQTGNQQNYLLWDAVPGVSSYQIQRSTDGINYGLYATISTNNYLDTVVTIGSQYWYQVASVTIPAFQSFGTMTLTGQPSPGDTFSLANVVFTAVASGATGNQFNIGATIAATVANIVSIVTTSLINVIIPSAASPIITFTSFASGPEGNAIQFSSALSNTTIAAFSGGVAGSVSIYTTPQSVVPTPTSEMTLAQLRLAAQQRCDRVNSNFVTLPEWTSYLNQSMYELYDLLITVYEDYYMAPRAKFLSNGATFSYPLPDGVLTFLDINNNPFIPAPFYKLLGVDLGIQSANNAFVTVNKYNLIDRNTFIYPNSASTIYGVFNLKYRVLGKNIEFIPTPSANQPIQLLYVPRLPQLLRENDITTLGISGWLEYVIVRAAILALMKEESDVQNLAAQLLDLRTRIESTAQNRDAGQPDHVSDVRKGGTGWDSNGYNGMGPTGGW